MNSPKSRVGRPLEEVPAGNLFGAWLRKERKKLGLTGEELAERAGPTMRQGRISSYERGAKAAEDETVEELALALAGPDASDEVKADYLRRAKAARMGIELGRIERVPDAEFVFETLEAYEGDDPRVIALKQMGELLRDGKRVTRDMPESELSGQE